MKGCGAPKRAAEAVRRFLTQGATPWDEKQMAMCLSILDWVCHSPKSTARVVVRCDLGYEFLCTMKDYVLVYCCNCVFRFDNGDEVASRDFRARYERDGDELERDEEYWSFERTEFIPNFGFDVEEALENAYDAWIATKSGLPDPREFLPIFEETLGRFPRPGVLILRGDEEEVRLSFPDMRTAALLVSCGAHLNVGGTPVSVASLSPKRVVPSFEDNMSGVENAWQPDPRQWAQMQEECAPRAEWTEMLRAARRVVSQKRLKTDGTLEK